MFQSMSADHTTTEVKAALHVAASHGDDYLETLKQLLKAQDINNNIVNNYGREMTLATRLISLCICIY